VLAWLSAGPLDVRAQLPPVVDLAFESADVEFLGARQGDRSGADLTSGDFNGDGYTDLVIAACFATPLGGQRQGEFYILWGPSAFTLLSTIDLLQESPHVSRIFGQPTDDDFNCQLSSGDLNNDGFMDVLLTGNYYEISTQLSRLDALRGELLINDRKGGFYPSDQGKFNIPGVIRDLEFISVGAKHYLAVGRNNDVPIFLELNSAEQ